MNKHKNSRPVYSTETGRLCPQCHRPVAGCVCGKDRPAATGDGIVRGGKAVTVIKGLCLPERELQDLARALKQKCGVGGSLKDGQIEIQGDQRPAIKTELEKRGFSVRIAGG
jgi:translation initiation factor 1